MLLLFLQMLVSRWNVDSMRYYFGGLPYLLLESLNHYLRTEIAFKT